MCKLCNLQKETEWHHEDDDFVICELCNLQKETEWYHEDDDFVICDCSSCSIPMIVYKHHTMTVPLDRMIRIMLQTKKLFGWKARVRANQRKISDHWHVHILTT
jgi:hypothetical protein